MANLIDKDEVKARAAGRWPEIILATCHVESSILDGHHHPCLKCGGTDRFRAFNDFADTGGVRCSKCHSDKNSDGFSTIQWLAGCDFPAAVRMVADHLGMTSSNGNGTTVVEDAVTIVARQKGITRESLLAYGAVSLAYIAVSVPAYDPQGKQCTTFTVQASGGKGKFAKGKKAGLFFPHVDGEVRLPAAGETWYLVEGVKDAAALHALGYLACGLNTCRLAAKFARLFHGVNVVIVPDRDKAGEEGAEHTTKVLRGAAQSIKVAVLPAEFSETDGADVRDVLKKQGGEELVRQAIKDARDGTTESGGDDDQGDHEDDDLNSDVISNGFQYWTVTTSGEEKIATKSLDIVSVVGQIREATGNWPRMANGALFVRGSNGVDWLEKIENYYGYLHTIKPVRWHSGVKFVSRAEARAEHMRHAPKYKAIEHHPHEPLLPDHYYLCDAVTPGDGHTLAKFLDFFCTETTIDRDLLQAAIMTMAWGGPGGQRPLFLITAKGRGFGKTTAAEALASVFDGVMSFSMNDRSREIKERLLTPESLDKRVALLDNVKTTKISNGDIEALVTASEISGKRMYIGEACRPNTITWFITVNGAALSKDMAQRSIPICLAKPKYSGDWDADIREFVESHRTKIIADIIGAIRGPSHNLNRYTRWGMWERDILEKLAEPNEAQAVICERQGALDTDAEEASGIVEHFAARLEDLNYDVDEDRVMIPTRVCVQWLTDATARPYNSTSGSQVLKQLIEEGDFPWLRRNTTKAFGRGFVWEGNRSRVDENIRQDIEERLKCESRQNTWT